MITSLHDEHFHLIHKYYNHHKGTLEKKEDINIYSNDHFNHTGTVPVIG